MKLAFLMVCLVSLSSHSAELKSSKLRSMVCDSIESSIDNDNISLTYSSDFEEDRQILPNFIKTCLNSKKSFQVINSTFNERANSVTKLDIKVNFSMRKMITVKGKISFGRTAFDPNTGEVKLGKWKINKKAITYNLGSKSLENLANAIADTANIHNGGVTVEKFKPSEYSKKKIIAAINKEIAEHNNEQPGCTMVKAEDNADYLFENSEDYSNGAALGIVEALKKKGYVLDIIGTTVDEWRESCAFTDVYIYLKNGNVIIINYDFTT